MAEKPGFVLPLEESDVTFSRLTKGRIRLLRRAFCRLYRRVYSPVRPYVKVVKRNPLSTPALSAWPTHSQAPTLSAVALQSRWACSGPRLCVIGAYRHLRWLCPWGEAPHFLACRSRALQAEVVTELHLTLGWDWQQSEMRDPGADGLVVDHLCRRPDLQSYSPSTLFLSVTFSVSAWQAWGKTGLCRCL